jgi:hypothetical protein
VNYLQPGLMASQTWVMGKMTSHLESLGYGRHNLRAVPYDWRIAPKFLQVHIYRFTCVQVHSSIQYDSTHVQVHMQVQYSYRCIHYRIVTTTSRVWSS